MNISYDKKAKQYLLGESAYSKEAFIAFIESDMLQSALSTHSGKIEIENGDGSGSIDEIEVGGTNILLYGVPGCGKSHYIEKNYSLTKDNCERVVFHPDYTYSDFVGQIMPQIVKNENDEKNKLIEYKFVAGPFSRILKKCATSTEMHYLIIEEINRGNAPAIFGDIFQLLDRDSNGTSKYWITNKEISEYLFEEDVEIRLPSNLTILATMNTADQNVFTLDTAFKRRWTMKAIKNKFIDDEHCNSLLCDTTMTWRKFATAVNRQIGKLCNDSLGSEDKRLGVYFLKDEEMSDKDIFAEKVIMYLWNDVFKYDKDKIFDSRYTLLEELLDDFQEYDFDVFNAEIWKDDEQ